jgi:hypothetical protein
MKSGKYNFGFIGFRLCIIQTFFNGHPRASSSPLPAPIACGHLFSEDRLKRRGREREREREKDGPFRRRAGKVVGGQVCPKIDV